MVKIVALLRKPEEQTREAFLHSWQVDHPQSNTR